MSEQPIHVACLCAAWCHVCEDYRSTFRAIEAEMLDHGMLLHWHWIDIEDEADLVGDVDVETFPTLLVAAQDRVRFAGPLAPHPDTLRRMLRATVIDATAGTAWPAVAHEVTAFAARLDRRTQTM